MLNLICDPYNERIMNLMGHSCRVDKHIQTLPERFYEAMARLWKVLNLFYENDKVKITENLSNLLFANNFPHFSLVRNLTFSL